MLGQYLPMLALFGLAALFAAGSFIASGLLAPRNPTVAKQAAALEAIDRAPRVNPLKGRRNAERAPDPDPSKGILVDNRERRVPSWTRDPLQVAVPLPFRSENELSGEPVVEPKVEDR